MIVVRSVEDFAQPRKQFSVPGKEHIVSWVERYCEVEVDDLYANAFRVEMAPNVKDDSGHFHSTDQFQLIVGGAGTFGKTAVQPYISHYAGAFTPYGPIRCGENGLKWMTLRNGRDPGGIKWMPQSRDILRSGGRKPRTAYGAPEIAMEADGMGVWRFQLKPGTRGVGVSPATGRGQFWVMLNGTGTVAGNEFGQESLLFVNPREPAVEIEAGPEGIDILGLQFPTYATT